MEGCWEGANAGQGWPAARSLWAALAQRRPQATVCQRGVSAHGARGYSSMGTGVPRVRKHEAPERPGGSEAAGAPAVSSFCAELHVPGWPASAPIPTRSHAGGLKVSGP